MYQKLLLKWVDSLMEWKKYYDPKRFRYDVLDRIQWSVIFEYSNGHKKEKFAGSNDYPYNFNEFMDIFCLDNVEIPIIKLKVLRRTECTFG